MNPYLSVLLDHLLQLAVFALVPVLSVVAFKLVKYFEMKFDVDLDDKYEAKLQELLKGGVLRAGEWARGKVKLGETAPAGALKLQKAIEFVQAELERQGYDKLAYDKIVDLTESVLAKTRFEATPTLLANLHTASELGLAGGPVVKDVT
jgi:hypothetical protein